MYEEIVFWWKKKESRENQSSYLFSVFGDDIFYIVQDEAMFQRLYFLAFIEAFSKYNLLYLEIISGSGPPPPKTTMSQIFNIFKTF